MFLAPPPRKSGRAHFHFLSSLQTRVVKIKPKASKTAYWMISWGPKIVTYGFTFTMQSFTYMTWICLFVCFKQLRHTVLWDHLIVLGQSQETLHWWMIPRCWRLLINMASPPPRSASVFKSREVFLLYPRVLHLLALKATLRLVRELKYYPVYMHTVMMITQSCFLNS